jgi:hypothetical protein
VTVTVPVASPCQAARATTGRLTLNFEKHQVKFNKSSLMAIIMMIDSETLTRTFRVRPAGGVRVGPGSDTL